MYVTRSRPCDLCIGGDLQYPGFNRVLPAVNSQVIIAEKEHLRIQFGCFGIDEIADVRIIKGLKIGSGDMIVICRGKLRFFSGGEFIGHDLTEASYIPLVSINLHGAPVCDGNCHGILIIIVAFPNSGGNVNLFKIADAVWSAAAFCAYKKGAT